MDKKLKEKAFLKNFCGKSEDEAKDIYKKFKSKISKIATNYSKIYGVDKDDLFSEGLFGLARALRDYKGDDNNLKEVVYRYVKNALSDYIRSNKNPIEIPPYIDLAQKSMNKIYSILSRYGISSDHIYSALIDGVSIEMPSDVSIEDLSVFMKTIGILQNNANRAGISVSELVRRCSIISVDIDSVESEPIVDTSTLPIDINKIKDDVDRTIIYGILNDKSYEEIAMECGMKGKQWVYERLKKIRKDLEGGTQRNLQR